MIAKEMIAEKVFAEGVAKDIRNFLPAKYENAEFQVMQMNKNNGVQMVGVQVRLQEENVCPVVYVEPFFNEIRLGEPVEKVMNEIARCMEEAGNAPFVHSSINPMDYDSVKEHLAVMLVNTQANKRMLQEMPHENMDDLSAICYVDFSVESNDGKATMKVKNEHLKMWNVDAKEMFHQVRANTQPVNTPILQSMDEMLLSIFNEEGHATNLLDESVDFGFRSHDMLYALTNVEKQYGASMITQPEVLNIGNVIISLLRKTIPNSIRMIVQLVVVAALVTVISEVLKAYAYDLNKQLSVFVGLIITNCILMGRLEAFALAHGPWQSFLDGIGNGVGYGIILVIIGFFRELLGSGTLLGYKVIPDSFYAAGYMNNGLMILPPMALILIACIIWVHRSRHHELWEEE